MLLTDPSKSLFQQTASAIQFSSPTLMTDMALPPLYKYLDVNGAKLTLGDRAFRHAKPSSFEDLEEMTVRSIFPEEEEVALATLSDGCVGAIVENINIAPTCGEHSKAAIVELQEILRNNPDAIDAVRDQIKAAKVFDVDAMRAMAEAFIEETNEFMQTYRILCVTPDNTSERMWEDYAQDHGGIALRIEPNFKKASKYELFRPVRYQASRPALYDRTSDFLKDSWFGDQEARSRSMLDKIIYTKTLRYSFEKEYRLAIPVGEEGDVEHVALPSRGDHRNVSRAGDD
jgi:hypothetical protein